MVDSRRRRPRPLRRRRRVGSRARTLRAEITRDRPGWGRACVRACAARCAARGVSVSASVTSHLGSAGTRCRGCTGCLRDKSQARDGHFRRGRVLEPRLCRTPGRLASCLKVCTVYRVTKFVPATGSLIRLWTCLGHVLGVSWPCPATGSLIRHCRFPTSRSGAYEKRNTTR